MITVFSKEVIAEGPDDVMLGTVGRVCNGEASHKTLTRVKSQLGPGHRLGSELANFSNGNPTMPKKAKKAWRKNINLDELYEGIRRTRQEIESGFAHSESSNRSGVVKEKTDAELFAIDDTGAGADDVNVNVQPPKKRRKPLRVDEILGTVDAKPSIPSHIPKHQRARATKSETSEDMDSYDVWTKVDVIPTPEGLPPPATLPYLKIKPAKPPATLRSMKQLLHPPESVLPVTVADRGQSYNPALEDWEHLVNRKTIEEKARLDKIAQKEWVPVSDHAETPAGEDLGSEVEENAGSSFLGKPVKAIRKTKTQRNKQLRQVQQVYLW
jgi:nucleolar protein 53